MSEHGRMGRRDAVAVVGVCDSPESAALCARVDARAPAEATWFAPRDLNDLEDAISAGRFGVVVFARPADFLEAVWSGDIRPALWRAAGVELEFAETEGGEWMWEIAGRYEAWRGRRRGAAMASCVVLSAVAAAAAFGLIWAAG